MANVICVGKNHGHTEDVLSLLVGRHPVRPRLGSEGLFFMVGKFNDSFHGFAPLSGLIPSGNIFAAKHLLAVLRDKEYQKESPVSCE